MNSHGTAPRSPGGRDGSLQMYDLRVGWLSSSCRELFPPGPRRHPHRLRRRPLKTAPAGCVAHSSRRSSGSDHGCRGDASGTPRPDPFQPARRARPTGFWTLWTRAIGRDAQLLLSRGCLIEGRLSSVADSGRAAFLDSTRSGSAVLSEIDSAPALTEIDSKAGIWRISCVRGRMA
jgi:hypothetical protein